MMSVALSIVTHLLSQMYILKRETALYKLHGLTLTTNAQTRIFKSQGCIKTETKELYAQNEATYLFNSLRKVCYESFQYRITYFTD